MEQVTKTKNNHNPTKSVDDAKVKVFFDRDIHKEMIRQIKNAKESIYICMAWIRHEDYRDAILEAKKRVKEIEINVTYVDKEKESEKKGSKPITDNFIEENININIIRKGKSQDMHNKYCIIDNKIVITGSFNWSYQAANYNFENIVVIESPEVAEKFKIQFFKIKKYAIPLQKGEFISEEYQKMINDIMKKLFDKKEVANTTEEMREKASSVTEKLFK